MSDGGDSDEKPAPRQARCAICGKPASERYRPFCSKRCADIDLARWLGGTYVIAGGNTDADEDGDEAASGFPVKDSSNAND
jgi:endogenous inhibitor of DNA gyrase (YacG/DUF329 family)